MYPTQHLLFFFLLLLSNIFFFLQYGHKTIFFKAIQIKKKIIKKKISKQKHFREKSSRSKFFKSMTLTSQEESVSIPSSDSKDLLTRRCNSSIGTKYVVVKY